MRRKRFKSEWAFQAELIREALRLGWKVFHHPDMRKAIGRGFPDLVLVKHRVVFAELKRPRKQPSERQREWRDALQAAGADWRIWRPADWDDIMNTLTGRD